MEYAKVYLATDDMPPVGQGIDALRAIFGKPIHHPECDLDLCHEECDRRNNMMAGEYLDWLKTQDIPF